LLDKPQIADSWTRSSFLTHKGWTRVPFGQFAQNINERVEPNKAAADIYVGLEHLVPQCLQVHRWGKGSDVIGTKLRFRKGDIIFGRRRAYQRKLAVAEFDGICSAHAMVVRAKPDIVLPDFLPFLMMSDKFMNRAVEISVGSLSPTINWTTLKLEEFDLPPLDQQRRIAEVLWAMDDAVQMAMELRSSLLNAKDTFFDNEMKRGTAEKPETLTNLGKALTEIIAGKSPKTSSHPALYDEFGVLKVSAVGDGVFREEENKALLGVSDFVPTLEVKPGMILVTRCNAILSGIGRACLVEETRPGLMLSDKTLQLVPKAEMIDPDFLLIGLRREPYRGYVERSASGTEAKNISQETLRAAPFWIPSMQQQLVLIGRLNQFTDALKLNQQRQKNLSLSLSALINEVIK
jgi:restriction endonuclease S subunit